MMTDRELLEMAAKAAGLRVKTWDGHTGPMCAIDDDRHGRMWMPLADDGDALRLAVKLNFCIIINKAAGTTHALPKEGPYLVFKEYVGDNAGAATRRAIVRAAASIGAAL